MAYEEGFRRVRIFSWSVLTLGVITLALAILIGKGGGTPQPEFQAVFKAAYDILAFGTICKAAGWITEGFFLKRNS